MPRYFLASVFILLFFVGGCVHRHRGAPKPEVPSSATVGQAGDDVGLAYPVCMDEDSADDQREDRASDEDPVEAVEDDDDVVVFEPSELSLEDHQVLHANFSFPLGIDIDANEDVQSYFALYVHKSRCTMQNWLKRAQRYMPYVHRRFSEEGLPDELMYLPFGESGYNPFATSPVGAAGLWQFMPQTGRSFGLRIDEYVDERRDPYKSTEAAIKYLKRLYGYFNDWPLALAAYNAGEGTIGKALTQSNCTDYFSLVASDSCLRRETRRYVPKFLALSIIGKNLETLKFKPLNMEASPVDTATLTVRPRTDLDGLARKMGMDWLTFRDFNPSLRKKMSAPDRKTKIAVPVSKLEVARTFLSSPASIVPMYAQYRVRSGDSLWKVAKSVGLSITELKRINHMSATSLRVGQTLRVPFKAGSGRGSAVEAAPVATSAPPVVRTGTYTVRPGDTFWEIAGRYGVSVAALQKANTTRSLRAGQTLVIPGADSREAQGTSGKADITYEVQPGDTVWSIAKKFDTSSEILLRHNNMSSGQTLRIGQKLRVSGAAGRPAKSSAANSVAYTVCQGDSLWIIARRFGVSTSDLMQWNKLQSTQHLRPGDILRVQTK